MQQRSEIIDILARTAWAEARSHGLDGMAAVLNVIQNRADRPAWWGRTLVEVCKARLQFSCWNANIAATNRIHTVDKTDPHFRDALGLAELLVEGKLRDRTGGADHYHADYVSPSWARGKRPVLIIGPKGSAHHFYRLGPT